MAVIEPMGPYSRPHRLAKIDGRTKLAKLMRETRAALIAHVGGHPSATQRALIERVVWLTVKCCQIDAKIAAGTDTEFDSAVSNRIRHRGHRGHRPIPYDYDPYGPHGRAPVDPRGCKKIARMIQNQAARHSGNRPKTGLFGPLAPLPAPCTRIDSDLAKP